jgi:hypothetical protein
MFLCSHNLFQILRSFLTKFGSMLCNVCNVCKKKGKATLITGRGCPQGCETSRLPHFLGNRLTDGGEVVSLKLRPPFTPRRISGTHFC